MRQRDQKVHHRVDDGEDGRQKVEERKVELLPEAVHVGWKRQEPQDPILLAGSAILNVREVEVGKGPGRDDCVVSQEKAEADDFELKDDAPVRKLGLFLLHLVIEDHDAGGNKVGEEEATDVEECILGKLSPRRMAHSKECGVILGSARCSWCG